MAQKQRALVLQGGGALGAYELGAFKALYEELPQIDRQNRQLFDVIAGTSIGAINAAILVSNFIKSRSWKDSLEALEGFWNHINSEPDIDMYTRYWNELYGQYQDPASKEAARRYYSAKHFQREGASKVFSRPTMKNDYKFFDNGILPNNIWINYNNDELRESIQKFAHLPVSTTKDDPRLLLVSVDVAEGATVTFDSHSKETEYGRYDKKLKKYERHVINHPNGITLDHVMASAAIPIFFDYVDIEGQKFWDGAVLSNTPLRELIHKHKTFWEKRIGETRLAAAMWNMNGTSNVEDTVPDLEVCIISLWPFKETIVPSDHDGIKDRKNDITYSDKTEYDEKVAVLVTDYVDLAKNIRRIAIDNMNTEQQKDKFKKALDNYLKNTDAESRRRDGKKRKLEDIIRGRFRLTGLRHNEITRIERADDKDSISNKFADFSSDTIRELIDDGYNDARQELHVGQTLEEIYERGTA